MKSRILFFSVFCIIYFCLGDLHGDDHSSLFPSFSVKLYGECAEFMVANQEGKKSGYDKSTGKILEEIGGPEGTGKYEDDISDEGTPNKFLEIWQRGAGLYNLFIIGTSSGIYSLNVRTQAGITYPVFGIISKGEEQHIEFNYFPDSDSKTTVRKVVDAVLLQRELEAAFKQGLIKGRRSEKAFVKQLETVENMINNNMNDKAREELKVFIDKLKKEKGLKEDDIIIDDAKILLGKL